MNQISKGLVQLGFSTGWAVSGDEIILWEHSEPQPSMNQILSAAEIYEEKQLIAKQQEQTKRTEVEAKLAALGLTADDLKALGL